MYQLVKQVLLSAVTPALFHSINGSGTSGAFALIYNEGADSSAIGIRAAAIQSIVLRGKASEDVNAYVHGGVAFTNDTAGGRGGIRIGW